MKNVPARRGIHLTVLFPYLDRILEARVAAHKFERFRKGLDTGKLIENLSEKSGVDEQLFALFGVDKPPGRDLPVGAVAWLGDDLAVAMAGEGVDGESAESASLKSSPIIFRADPVHILPGREHLRVIGAKQLAISLGEAQNLVDGLNAYFEQDGLVFEIASPGRWYLKVASSQDLELETVPSEDIISGLAQGALADLLPRGPDARRWHSLMNEMQMILHQSQANQARASKGQPTISAVWLSGGGRLPSIASRSHPHPLWQGVFADGPVVRGLAQSSQSPLHSLPPDYSSFMPQLYENSGKYLIAFDNPHESEGYELASWYQDFAGTDRQWCIPLIDALKSGDFSSIRWLTGKRAIETVASDFRGKTSDVWRRLLRTLTGKGRVNNS